MLHTNTSWSYFRYLLLDYSAFGLETTDSRSLGINTV